jgi:hypothetical protein
MCLLTSNLSIPCQTLPSNVLVKSCYAYYHLPTYRLEYCRKDTKKPQVGESIAAAAQHLHASQTKSRQRRAPPSTVCLYMYLHIYIHPTRSNLPFPKSSARSLNTSISHHHSKQAQNQQIKQTKQERKDTPPPSGAIIRTHSPRHNRILSLRRIFSAYPQPRFG